MSEPAILAIFGMQSVLILTLAGWLFAHERSCAARWSNFMAEHGRLLQMLQEWNDQKS